MHSSTDDFTCANCKVNISCLKNFAQFCQVKCQCWQNKRTMMDFFVFISRSETTHFASFLFPVSYSSAAQKAKISLIALTVASLDNHLVLHARCNCRPFVFIVVWCITRQTDRNGFTVKHFHNCSKVLSQFRIPYCTNLQQYSKRLRLYAWLCTDTKLRFSLPNSAPENWVGL